MTDTDPLADEKALAVRMYEANLAKNEADRLYKATRENLYKALQKKGVKEFTTPHADADGKAITLIATVEAKDREVVDTKLLRKKVTDAQFMLMVSATKSAVEEHAGKALCAQVCTLVPGEENVTVKKLKA